MIATNESQHRIQIDRCGADPRRCYVVRNGPNELFTPSVEPLQELRGPGKIVLGYVGLMGFQDGIDYFIRALAKFREHRTDFSAVLVGRGPALESLKKLTEDLGLKDHVFFAGFVEFRKVPRYIAAFDICVTPDPSNPYNDSCTTIKTMEYMAVGRPTVAYRTKENEITAGEAALYAEDNNVEEFADLMLKLADDPELRTRKGKIGRERIEHSLAWSHQKKVLVQVYADLFAGRLRENARPIELESQFLFDGRLDEVLNMGLSYDMEHATLSGMFRFYYRVRPFLPTVVRQWFQRNRSKNSKPAIDWYIPKPLHDALQKLPQPLNSPWPESAEFALILTHYDASCFDVDPYQAMPGGVGGIWPFKVGKFVELPYTMPQDHTLFVSLGETSDCIWRDKLRFI